MKKIFTLALVLSVLSVKSAMAALTGIYVVPGHYLTLADFIAAANTEGLSGPVTLELRHNELAPSGGYLLGSALLNGTMSMTNTLTINGNNWTLTANAGTGGQDAIFTIQGTDFVTINKMNLKDTATNTTNATMMERGYSVVKFMNGTNIDATRYLTIKGSHINLFNTNTSAATGIAGAGSTGIFVGNCLFSSATALAAPGDVEGSFETLFFTDDTITNVTHGVYGRGLAQTIDGIIFNDKQLTVQNSQIHNFTHFGVNLAYFNNDFVSGNHIANMDDGGAAPTDHSIYGVSYDAGTAITTNASWTCQNNAILLSSASAAADQTIGISSRIYGSGTTTISGNIIDEAITGSGNVLIGILAKNNGGSQSVSGNTIQNFSVPSTNTSNIVGIWTGAQAAFTPYGYPLASTITNNVIRDFTIGGGATVAACIDQNLVSTTDPSVFTGNTVSGFKITGNVTTFKGYQFRNTSSAATLTANNNTFADIDASGTTTPGILIDPAANSTVVSDINGNHFQRISFGSGTLTGVLLENGVKATCSKDSFVNFKSSGDIHAFFAGNSGAAIATLQFDNNQIDSFASDGTGSVVTGINIYPGTTTTTSAAAVYNNTIKRLNSFGTAAVTLAIAANGGSATYNVYNNMISDIAAPNNTGIFSSSYGLYMMGVGVNNVSYNTVNLFAQTNPASGYGATGLMYSPAGTSTIKNNILRVNVQAGTGNNVTAIRGNTGSAKSAPSLAGFSSSNNVYFTPAGPNNFLYVDGTANTGLVNGYAVSGLTEDAAQNIVNDTFFNSDCGRSSYHKFMGVIASREKGTYTEDNLTGTAGWYAPTGYTYAESGATPVAAVGSDIVAESRGTTPDMGAIQFSGTLLPTMNITVVSSTGFDIACPANLPELNSSIPAFFTHASYQWFKDTTEITGATTPDLIVDPVTSKYILKVYDSLTGCTYAADAFEVTIVPPPPAMITYYDSLVFCATSSIVVSANSGTDYTYQWYKDGSPISGATDIAKVISTGGNYQVEVNTPLGCPTMSAPIGVRVYPLPTPTITQVGMNQLKTDKYYTYQWYKDNVVIPDDPARTSKGQFFYATEDGAYTVEVTDSNGCTNKATVYLYTLGINDPSLSQAIKVYPNPSAGIVNIASPVPVMVSLTDATGRVILAPSKVSTIDLSQYAAGLYILTLSDENGREIRKEKITRLQQ
jgi:hypothetical protein